MPFFGGDMLGIASCGGGQLPLAACQLHRPVRYGVSDVHLYHGFLAR